MQSLLEAPPHKWHPLLVQFLIFSVLQNLLATTMLPLCWYDTRFFNRMENMPRALPGHCTPSPKPRMLLIPPDAAYTPRLNKFSQIQSLGTSWKKKSMFCSSFPAFPFLLKKKFILTVQVSPVQVIHMNRPCGSLANSLVCTEAFYFVNK